MAVVWHNYVKGIGFYLTKMSFFRNLSLNWPLFAVFRTSLRVRVAFGVALPVFVALMLTSSLHYWREYLTMEEQVRINAIALGDMLNNSVSHAMQIKDNQHLMDVLSDVGRLDMVHMVQIVGISGKVLVSSDRSTINETLDVRDSECWVCHQIPIEERPRTIELETAESVLRIASPIANFEQCNSCHAENQSHLGILLIDASLQKSIAHLINDLRIDLIISLLMTSMTSFGVYWLVSRQVVQRIESLQGPILAYTAGDYSARIPKHNPYSDDELDQLASSFNHMADEIRRYTHKLDELSEVRQQAIYDERERIARELHDGVAQVLGYVATKSNAVRIMVKKNRLKDADRHLKQLENAVQEQFGDVRQAILGLRIASQVDSDLPETLKDYIVQFNQMSEVDAQLVLPAAPMLSLPPETVLHLLRVVQEALTNARKHAQASQIRVEITQNNGFVRLEISDNGQGFTHRETLLSSNRSFGLRTMQERADEIGAQLQIRSEVGQGTRVSLALSIGEDQSRRA